MPPALVTAAASLGPAATFMPARRMGWLIPKSSVISVRICSAKGRALGQLLVQCVGARRGRESEGRGGVGGNAREGEKLTRRSHGGGVVCLIRRNGRKIKQKVVSRPSSKGRKQMQVRNDRKRGRAESGGVSGLIMRSGVGSGRRRNPLQASRSPGGIWAGVAVWGLPRPAAALCRGSPRGDARPE